MIDKVALCISVLAFVLSVIQFLKESSRQKNESTLIAYRELQEDVFTKLNVILCENDKEDLERLEPGDALWEEITEFLVKIELFVAGIQTGIYSFNIFKQVGGGYFVRIYDSLELIIKKKQEQNNNESNRYNNLKEVVAKIKGE